jgi:hypothetical protein
MKESYRKGVATHPGLESCEGGRKTTLEALTEVYVGWPLSSEIVNQPGDKPTVSKNRKATRRRALMRVRRSPAESQTPCMHRNSTRENREAPLSTMAPNGCGPVGESDER